MKVIMLSTDQRLFEEGSARSRMVRYGSIVSELTVVVFGAGSRREEKITENVTIVRPGGSFKFTSVVNALRYLLARAADVDLISSQDPFMLGLTGLFVARMKGVPLQIQVHTDCFSIGYLSESLRRTFEALLARFVIRGANAIRVVSKRLEREVAALTARPITVLPIQNEFKPKSGTARPRELGKGFTLVTVSRLTREKQVGRIIEAVALVPRVSLVIVGEGPERKMLENIRERHGLVARVKFALWQADIAPYLEHADAYVSASRYEGYGLSLLEAARYGKAIITTDVGIVGDVLVEGHEALVVRASPHDIASAITRLIEEPALAASIGAQARHAAEAAMLSEEEYLERYRQALESAASKP